MRRNTQFWKSWVHLLERKGRVLRAASGGLGVPGGVQPAAEKVSGVPIPHRRSLLKAMPPLAFREKGKLFVQLKGRQLS